MCLYANTELTNKLKTSKKKVIDVYKIYMVAKGGKHLTPPFRYTPVVKNPGIVKSNRKSNKILKSEIIDEEDGHIDSRIRYFARIQKGIHVCLKKVPKSNLALLDVVLKCQAKIENLVAAGDGEAVCVRTNVLPSRRQAAPMGIWPEYRGTCHPRIQEPEHRCDSGRQAQYQRGYRDRPSVLPSFPIR